VVLTSAINPGLGIRKLHEYGITGKGISVAVIDKPILSTHREFSGRIEYIEVYKDHPKNKRLHFHGIACASLLAGEKCGVANQSPLYYFAVPDDGNNVRNYAAALEKILQISSELPGPKKIKVVSISDGIPPDKKDNPDSIKLLQTIKEAEKQGIAVIHCGVFPINFLVSGCPPGKDRDDAENYELWLRWQKQIFEMNVSERNIYLDKLKLRIGNHIFVPGDYRTTASNAGDGEYAYWGEGGLSWACPYLAGLVALGLQANTSMSVQDLYRVLIETSTFNRFGMKVVNPEAYIRKAKQTFSFGIRNPPK
jgi:subtilisin family serine protease